MWGCLEEIPVDAGIVAELERRVRSAAEALGVIDRRLADAPVGSLTDVVAAQRTLRTVLKAIESRTLRDVYVAIESVVAEMEAFEAALALVRRLRSTR